MYWAYGQRIASVLELPELAPADRGPADCSLRWEDARRARRGRAAPPRWFHRLRLPDGRLWLAFGTAGRRFCMRFSGRADFFCSAEGRTIWCRPRPGAPRELLRRLLLTQALPLALSLRRKRVLHASAVAGPRGVLAFLGGTGAGKSTLAAYLSTQGFALAADDGLALQETRAGFRALPSYAGSWLWPDARAGLARCGWPEHGAGAGGEKGRAGPGPGKQRILKRPVRLRRIYVLDLAGRSARGKRNVVLSPLSKREAFLALCAHTFRLDLRGNQGLRGEFEALSRLASRALFKRLTYPRDFARLAAVRRAILDDLSSEPRP